MDLTNYEIVPLENLMQFITFGMDSMRDATMRCQNSNRNRRWRCSLTFGHISSLSTQDHGRYALERVAA